MGYDGNGALVLMPPVVSRGTILRLIRATCSNVRGGMIELLKVVDESECNNS